MEFIRAPFLFLQVVNSGYNKKLIKCKQLWQKIQEIFRKLFSDSVQMGSGQTLSREGCPFTIYTSALIISIFFYAKTLHPEHDFRQLPEPFGIFLHYYPSMDFISIFRIQSFSEMPPDHLLCLFYTITETLLPAQILNDQCFGKSA